MQETTEVVPYLTSAAMIYFVQKYLKSTSTYAQFVKALPGAAKWAHWLVAGIGSVVAAVGIHFTITGSADTGWSGTFNIPDVWTMLHALWDVTKVFVLQQWAYETTKPRPWFPNPDSGVTPAEVK